jgi:hypothetical protein
MAIATVASGLAALEEVAKLMSATPKPSARR